MFENMAHCYMLASISNMLQQQQHQGMQTNVDIMISLQALFGETFSYALFDVINTIMNSSMKFGMPVRDHLLKMMNLFNEAKINS